MITSNEIANSSIIEKNSNEVDKAHKDNQLTLTNLTNIKSNNLNTENSISNICLKRNKRQSLIEYNKQIKISNTKKIIESIKEKENSKKKSIVNFFQNLFKKNQNNQVIYF